MGRYDESIAEIETLDFDELSAGDTAEALGVLVLAELQRGALDGIEPMATLARVKAYEAGYVEIEAEIEYVWAVYLIADQRYADARSSLLQIIALDENASSNQVAKALTLDIHALKARAYDVLGYLAGREHRYEEKGSLDMAGLEELSKSEHGDRYLEAVLMANLANLSVDICLPGVHDFMRIRLEKMSFCASLTFLEFQIHRAIGLGFAMHGNHVGALRSFRYSAEIAPDTASRIKALVDRSVLAYELGEVTFADEESDYALQLSRQVDWRAEGGPTQIFALLLLSNGLATRNATEARRVLELYQSCKRRFSSIHSASGDAGLAAREMCTDALISRTEGDTNRAIRLNREAFDMFQKIGYDWRAADVAIELYELTGERRFLKFAVEYSREIPHSQFALRVKRHEARLAVSA